MTTAAPPTVKVNEVFGPTLQGEGPYIGQPCIFVRFAECNLTCHWCDTPYTWAYSAAKASKHVSGKQYERTTEIHNMSAMEIRQRVLQLSDSAALASIVVFSGGEPLLQSIRDPRRDDILAELAETLNNTGHRVHVETAGTLLPSTRLARAVKHFSISPKLDSSGNPRSKTYHSDVLDYFKTLSREKSVVFKYVICDLSDLEEVDLQVKRHAIPKRLVMLMPEASNVEKLQLNSRKVAEAALARGYGFSTRLHIYLWGDERAH